MTFMIDTILQVIYFTNLLRFSRDAQLDLFVTGELAIEVGTIQSIKSLFPGIFYKSCIVDKMIAFSFSPFLVDRGGQCTVSNFF